MALRFTLLLTFFLLGVGVERVGAEEPNTANTVPSIYALRMAFSGSVENSDLTKKTLLSLQAQSDLDALRLAYLGAFQALQAKHVWSPYAKISYLNDAKSSMAKAIEKDRFDPEVRFLRFSIEHFVPSYLGYSGHLSEDLSVILTNLGMADTQVKPVIGKFLRESGRLSPAQLLQLTNWGA